MAISPKNALLLWKYGRKKSNYELSKLNQGNWRNPRATFKYSPSDVSSRTSKKPGAIPKPRALIQVTVSLQTLWIFRKFARILSAEENSSLFAESILSEFWRIVEMNGVEKIKTVGDSYHVCAWRDETKKSGLSIQKNMIKQQFEMNDYYSLKNAKNLGKWKPSYRMRIGIHTGPGHCWIRRT